MGTFLTAIASHGDTIIVAIVAMILGWDKFRSGSSTLRKEIAADYKERNDQLEVKIKELEAKWQQSLVDNASFKATIVEKDKHIANLTALNQGKNPDLVDLLKEIRDFMKGINDQNKHQTEMLETGKKRNELIDEASKKHLGEPALIPKR